MTHRRITLDECGRQRHLQALTEGRYALEYTDSTHLDHGKWVRLGYVDVRAHPIEIASEDSEQFYTFTADVAELPAEAKDGATRVVLDVLSLALGRLGLITPAITPELRNELLALDEQDGVVIVPDTNALHNGALHWLLRALRRPSILILPVVASLTTIQNRDAIVKGHVNKRSIANLAQALRSRGLVNASLGLLQRNRGRCQVVEIDHALLRYAKSGSNKGNDPDQSDIFEDRIMIEAIHGVLRTMRSRTSRRVITSDVNIARVLEAEGIETLFVPTIIVGKDPVDCLRYDALARGFVGAPLRALLWELAHAFSAVRLTREKELAVGLECYWPGKSPSEWTREVLQIEIAHALTEGAVAAPTAKDLAIDDTDFNAVPAVEGAKLPSGGGEVEGNAAKSAAQPAQGSETPARPDPAAVELGKRAVSKPAPKQRKTPATVGRSPKGADGKASRPIALTAPLPRASFPQLLRLLASARRQGSGTAETITAGLDGEPVTVDTARRGLEILRRARLLELQAGRFRATPDADATADAIANGDLDLVSTFMERFEPYGLFRSLLRERGRISRAEAGPAIMDMLGGAGTYEAQRLPRFHTLLGQAWTLDDMLMDGSQRLTDRDATDAFERSFAATSSVGIATVRDLLQHYCTATLTSPWAAKRQIGKFVADGLLPGYTFQPAAGGKPITRDEIVTGPLDQVEVEPVIVDRFTLGNRPVFTIEGPSR